jgi:hypothetical protein
LLTGPVDVTGEEIMPVRHQFILDELSAAIESDQLLPHERVSAVDMVSSRELHLDGFKVTLDLLERHHTVKVVHVAPLFGIGNLGAHSFSWTDKQRADPRRVDRATISSAPLRALASSLRRGIHPVKEESFQTVARATHQVHLFIRGIAGDSVHSLSGPHAGAASNFQMPEELHLFLRPQVAF